MDPSIPECTCPEVKLKNGEDAKCATCIEIEKRGPTGYWPVVRMSLKNVRLMYPEKATPQLFIPDGSAPPDGSVKKDPDVGLQLPPDIRIT